MPTALIIISIISAIFALIIELICSEQSARVVWLGSLCLFYLINACFCLILSKSQQSMSITKQIILFLTVGIASALFSLIVATIVIGALTKKEDKPEEDENASDENSEEKEG